MATRSPSVSLLDRYEGDVILPLYTTRVPVGGGESKHARAFGVARSDCGDFDLQLRMPKALGGLDGGVNPKLHFAARHGACFLGALSLVAARRKAKLPANLNMDVAVTFGRVPDDRLFLIPADLVVDLPGLEPEVADELVADTVRICPYSKMAEQGIKSTIRRA